MEFILYVIATAGIVLGINASILAYTNRNFCKKEMLRFQQYIIQKSEEQEDFKSWFERFYERFELVLHKLEFSQTIEHELDSNCSRILEDNKDLPERFVNTIIDGRDFTKKYAIHVFFSKLELTVDSLESEASAIFDVLKSKLNEDYPEIRVIRYTGNGVEYGTYAKYLKEKHTVQNILAQLKSSIIAARRGDYNGKTEEIFIKNVSDFMKAVIKEGITAFREFQQFQQKIP